MKLLLFIKIKFETVYCLNITCSWTVWISFFFLRFKNAFHMWTHSFDSFSFSIYFKIIKEGFSLKFRYKAAWYHHTFSQLFKVNFFFEQCKYIISMKIINCWVFFSFGLSIFVISCEITLNICSCNFLEKFVWIITIIALKCWHVSYLSWEGIVMVLSR